ncbi:hypothetical protein P43SY_009512 [Pythium insidiosum]|uniref:EF-hand domain-containing protein n=1 Tax=Pythium insidiosum TaxID=114742 RepID=A0AAD5M170_PYTIN|nr:hypothetical protein P43SY_009512 [Pythium insidiosum]
MASRLLGRAVSTTRLAPLALSMSAASLYGLVNVRSEGAPPSFSERTIGNYENRLRRFSSPERVFEYFSSVEIDKQFYMTREDLARAVTPYTYRSGAPLTSPNYKYNFHAITTKPSKDTVAEYTRRVKDLLIDRQSVTPHDVLSLLQFRDENGVDFETHVKALRSLAITNAEFDQFVVLHGGPKRERTFFDMVDADGDGLISYTEYMFFNTLLAIPQRQFELAFKMFDADGNGRLDHREFKRIMDLMRLRTPAGRQDRSIKEDDAPVFKHLFGELATETLSYEDFCAFRSDLKKEIMRIQISSLATPNAMDHGDGRITEDEFVGFMTFLDHLDELKVAIDLIMEDKGLNKGDGHLSPKEFIDVMQKRKDGGFTERRDTGAFQLLMRVKECIESSV